MLTLTEQEAFKLKNGEVLWSLQDLKKKLNEIPDEVFTFHISNSKNDFSNWIQGVFRNEELAQAVRKIKTKKTLIKKLEEAGI